MDVDEVWNSEYLHRIYTSDTLALYCQAIRTEYESILDEQLVSDS